MYIIVRCTNYTGPVLEVVFYWQCCVVREEICQAWARRMHSSRLSAARMQGPTASAFASHSQGTEGLWCNEYGVTIKNHVKIISWFLATARNFIVKFLCLCVIIQQLMTMNKKLRSIAWEIVLFDDLSQQRLNTVELLYRARTQFSTKIGLITISDLNLPSADRQLLLHERFSKFLNRVKMGQYVQLQFTSGMTATCTA